MALYLRLLRASIRSRMQYQMDFIASTIMYAFITLVDFLTVAAIVWKYGNVHGWTMYEVATLSGIASASHGLYRTFCAELDTFERYLVNGEFDSLLIRPWPTLASLLSRNFDLGRVGGLVQGVVVLAVGLSGMGAPAWLWVYAYTLPVAGACIITSCCLIAATAGFWIIRIADLQTFTLNAPNAAAQYPMDIFPKWMKGLFTYLLPVACISYFPLTYALGKGGAPWLLVVPYLAAAAALSVTYRLWRFGERRYQSSGS